MFTFLVPVFALATCQSVCPAPPWPRDCPGVKNGLRKTDETSLVIGGVFSISPWRVDSRNQNQQECSLCRRTREGAATATATAIRFGVEQAEALILAIQLLGNLTGFRDQLLGYDITDSCGNHKSEQKSCISQLSPVANTLATVVGPYYADISVSLIESEVVAIYSRLTPKPGSNQGVFSLRDVPFLDSPAAQQFIVSSGGIDLTQVVMLQQTCELQARAAVEFAVHERWKDITVVGSGDACGAAALRLFKEQLESNKVSSACGFKVTRLSNNSVGSGVCTFYFSLFRQNTFLFPRFLGSCRLSHALRTFHAF